MSSSSEDNLSLSTTRSSTRSSMKIAMPPPPSAFVHPSPAYIMTPSPSQNPEDASWSVDGPVNFNNSQNSQEQEHHRRMHRVHISTPHPLAATANFLDKHVPMFAKHHNEFQTQAEMRAARREARRSVIDTPIPEVDAESLPSVSAAIHAVTATAAGPALAGADPQHALDPKAWSEILAKREAARMRSGSNMTPQPDVAVLTHDSHSDSDSKTSGSPAITP